MHMHTVNGGFARGNEGQGTSSGSGAGMTMHTSRPGTAFDLAMSVFVLIAEPFGCAGALGGNRGDALRSAILYTMPNSNNSTL